MLANTSSPNSSPFLQPFIRVSSRDPTKHTFPPTVQVVKADAADPTTFSTLFNEIDSAFMYLQGTDNTARELVSAAKIAGVKHLVFLSSYAINLTPSSFIAQRHIKVEEAIKVSGITYTFIRPSLYYLYFEYFIF
jgi:uncharacterized protein YbjT (DUF2867 family)